jgi:hypothetical protein
MPRAGTWGCQSLGIGPLVREAPEAGRRSVPGTLGTSRPAGSVVADQFPSRFSRQDVGGYGMLPAQRAMRPYLRAVEGPGCEGAGSRCAVNAGRAVRPDGKCGLCWLLVPGVPPVSR